MDVTEVIMQLATAALAVAIPVIVAYLAYYAKLALKALETKKYAEALKSFDAELYVRLSEAGQVALEMAADKAVSFGQRDVKPYLYKIASETSKAFREKAGVRIDLNQQRVDTLIELAIREAKKAIEQETQPVPPARQ